MVICCNVGFFFPEAMLYPNHSHAKKAKNHIGITQRNVSIFFS